jgi:hypothetical protein
MVNMRRQKCHDYLTTSRMRASDKQSLESDIENCWVNCILLPSRELSQVYVATA